MDEPPFTTLLARQGIYDKNRSVYAYELLYRKGNAIISNVDNSNEFSGTEATSSVITQLFANLDINTIVGDKRAHINFNYSHLVQQTPCLLPKDRIVIEVLETVAIDKLLLTSLKSLHDQGYKIALDDFIFDEEHAPLIPIADIIKVDVLNLSKEQIAEQLIPLQHFKGKLLAEKIEDHTQFQNCIDLGFDYFQGFFLNKPKPLKGQQLTENKVNLLRLLAELNKDEVTLERLEEIILQIPKLSYRILRLANSTFSYRGLKIDSMMDAIKKLGLNQISNWLCLFILSSHDEMVPDLLERTLIRAKMCEHLAHASGHSNPHQAYTVGIFSTLDAILNEPMHSLLGKVQLSELFNEALLHQKGELGTILQWTIDYEKADFIKLDKTPYQQQDFIQFYLKGIEYANSVMGIINK